MEHKCEQMGMSGNIMDDQDDAFPLYMDIFKVLYEPKAETWCIDANEREFTCPIFFCPYCGIKLEPPQSEANFQGGLA